MSWQERKRKALLPKRKLPSEKLFTMSISANFVFLLALYLTIPLSSIRTAPENRFAKKKPKTTNRLYKLSKHRQFGGAYFFKVQKLYIQVIIFPILRPRRIFHHRCHHCSEILGTSARIVFKMSRFASGNIGNSMLVLFLFQNIEATKGSFRVTAERNLCVISKFLISVFKCIRTYIVNYEYNKFHITVFIGAAV